MPKSLVWPLKEKFQFVSMAESGQSVSDSEESRNAATAN
jgi:hypothetical protein